MKNARRNSGTEQLIICINDPVFCPPYKAIGALIEDPCGAEQSWVTLTQSHHVEKVSWITVAKGIFKPPVTVVRAYQTHLPKKRGG